MLVLGALLVLTGAGAAHAVEVSLEVEQPAQPAPNPEPMPVTGFDVAGFALAAMTLIFIGKVLHARGKHQIAGQELVRQRRRR